MHFIKLPFSALLLELSPRELSILVYLHFLFFKYCGSGRQNTFFISDRSLAKDCKCSTKSVWEAKKKLSGAGLIKFTVGTGNITFYSL